MTKHPRHLHIVADENIPIDAGRLAAIGTLDQRAASDIDSAAVRNADALLVRSVTRVDEELLAGSRVQFVGTATTGTDHVDAGYLTRAGIVFADAAGSNALSVVDYTLAVIAVALRRSGWRLSGTTVGVVGCGRIGEELARRLEVAGATVLRCDPPRERIEGPGFVPLQDLLQRSDIVTIHTPLTHAGADHTFHLISHVELDLMPDGAWLINTSRGAVVDKNALKTAIQNGRRIRIALDVWEGEPDIDPTILDSADIATPHIAGYAFDAKLRGAEMVLLAMAAFFTRDLPSLLESDSGHLRVVAPDPFLPATDAFLLLSQRMYDVEKDDRRMREALSAADDRRSAFANLRRTYPIRREYSSYSLITPASTRHARVVAALGVGGGRPDRGQMR